MLNSRPKLGVAALWAMLLTLSPLAPASADVTALAPDSASSAAPAPVAPPPIEPARRSPRAVLRAFFERMRNDDKGGAAELLDLSHVSAVAAEKRGPDLAFKLYRLIRNLGVIPIDLLTGETSFADAPDAADYQEPWSLSQWLIDPEDEASDLVILAEKDGGWQFSSETVGRIDSLYEEVEARIDTEGDRAQPLTASTEPEPTPTLEMILRDAAPIRLRQTHFLIPTYQWILLGCLIPIGRVVEKATRLVLTQIGNLFLKRIDPEFIESHETTARVWKPVGRLAHAATWIVGADQIGLPLSVDFLFVLLRAIAIVAAVLAIYRVLDLVAGYFSRRAKRRNRKSDDLVIPLATTTAKVVATLGGVIVAVASLQEELPATLIGGLGIGGIAIALASQETLSNFFGSITLLFDRPFEVGDWVRIDTLEGEVESLGFRSTKIRTGINSQVTVPNSKLASANIDNWGRRKYRRYLNKLGLEYGTPPDRIEAFCEGVRELIRRHPHTRKDFYAAYFNDFGAASLDVIVVAYFEAPDWVTELRERHRLLADIARLAESLGVAFAFPTQTLHLHRAEAHPTAPPIGGDDEADRLGARKAAEIAGELPNYQDRPGRVKFPGPTPLD